MATDIRVGGAFVTLSAQSGPYVAGIGAATAANRRLIQSYAGFSGALAISNRVFSRFSASVSSSLIATAAYATGVGLVANALRSVFTGFLDYDQALIRISKTTEIANEDLERLGENLVSIGTDRFRGRRPIDIAREDILNIAVAAGQAGVTDPRGVETLTRASAALQSSSDLIGAAAVRALTRYLQVTDQGIQRTDAIASAFTHLGNNVVGTEAEISRFAVRMAQNLSAVGQATDANILGISATLLEAGVEMEAAGSALQRAQLGILRQAGDASAFRFIGEVAGEAADEFEALRQRFIDGTASAEDYDTALLALLRTYRRLPDVATDTLPSRPAFLAAFVGGGESNVRNTRVLAALANRMERLERNTAIANEGLENQNAHFTEAERAAEAYRARLGVVGREIEEFGTDLGSQVVPAITVLAENLDLLGSAALFAGTALATGLGARRLRTIREAARASRDLARQEAASARTALSLARQRQDTTRRQIVGANQVALAHRQVEQQQRALAATYLSTERAQRRLTQAQANAARVQRNFAQLGRPAVARATLGVSAAQAEVDRQLRRQADAQRALTQTQAVVARGRPQDTRQLLRGLRRYEQRANQTRVAVMRLDTAQQNLARATRTVGQRFLAAGRGLFNFFGGPLGLALGAFAALPLILSRTNDEISEAEQNIRDAEEAVSDLLAAQRQQTAGRTDEGEVIRQAQEALSGLRLTQQTAIGQLRQLAQENFEDAVARSVELGASPEAFDRARRILSDALRALSGDLLDVAPDLREVFDSRGLGEDFDALVARAQRIRDLEDDTSDLADEMAGVGDAATQAGQAIEQALGALPPSVLRAEQAFQSFRRSLTDARADAATAARFDVSVAGLGPIETIQRRLIEGERQRIVQFQRANQLAAEQAAAAREEAEAQRNARQQRVDALDVGTEARETAEAELAAAERRVTQAIAQEAVTRRLAELSAGLTIDAERQIELGRQAIEQRRGQVAQFEADTAQQVAGIRPDLDTARVDALRQEIDLSNQLRDAQRDVTQTRAIDAEESVAHQQAIRDYFNVLNTGADALRSAQDDLRVNELARELAARRVVELNQERVAAGDQVTDALLEEIRATENHLATLRAEHQELELTLALVTALQDRYRNLADQVRAAADVQRDNALDDLVLSNIEILDELAEAGAGVFRGLGDEIASTLVSGEGNWRDFADNVIQELLRIAVQATIVNNLVAGLGLGQGQVGSIGGVLGNLFGNIFHEGGRPENGGQRRPLRSGLRSDELFAILQRGEIVVPRHLASHLLAGNLDPLRGWLAGLPRYHEGGVAGGGHLEREDILRLTTAIQQLQAVVMQLQTVVLGLGGGPDQLAPAFPPAAAAPAAAPQQFTGLPGPAQGVPEPTDLSFFTEAERAARDFADDAESTLRQFFLEDIPNYAEQARRFIDQEVLAEGDRGQRFGEGPFARGQRAFEAQARDRALAQDVELRRDQIGRQRDDLGTRVEELLERARQPVVVPEARESIRVQEEILLELREQRRLPEPRARRPQPVEITPEILERIRQDMGDDERFFRLFPDLEERFGAPSRREITPEFLADAFERAGELTGRIIRADEVTTRSPFSRRQTPEFRAIIQEAGEIARRNLPEGRTLFPRHVDAIIEELRRTARPYGDQTDANRLRELERLRELIDRIEVDAPIPRFRPEPGAIRPGGIQFVSAEVERRRVGDTPRPDLLPDGEDAIILFRQQSTTAFAESADALTGTFGASGVAGRVLTEDSAGLLEGVFGQGGLLGRLVGESEGLMAGLFNNFSGGLAQALNSALSGVSGGGAGGILGALFGFHEGSGDVGPGGRLYHRPAGLRRDEFLAVLQHGEIVLPRSLAHRLRTGGFHSLPDLQVALSRLPRFHEGGVVGGAGPGAGRSGGFRVELINTTNTPIEAVDNGQRVDAGDRVQSLILRDIRRNGPMIQGIRHAVRQS